MITVALCDDEYSTIIELEDLLFDIAKILCIKVSIDVFLDGSELEKSISMGENFDIIFLDIEMHQDGILTAKRLRRKGVESLIIYISNYERYLKELFEVDTFRFLSKPIDKEKVKGYFSIAVDKIQKDNSYFVFRYNREIRREKISNILYFESNKRKILLHKRDGKILEFYGKLNDLEQNATIENAEFLRTHQSFLVNLNYIYGWRNSSLELENGIRIPISEEQQKHIREIYSDYIQKDIF